METRRLEVNRQRRAHDPEYLPCAPIFHQFRWDHYDQCRGKLIGGSGDADLEVHQGADAACPWNSQLDLNSTNFLLISVGFDLIAHQDEATEGMFGALQTPECNKLPLLLRHQPLSMASSHWFILGWTRVLACGS